MQNDEIRIFSKYLERISKAARKVNGRNMQILEIAKIRSKSDEYHSKGYDPKLILADVCLAWRNKYKNKVIPRIQDINKRFQEVKTLEDLKNIIIQLDDRFNEIFWNFKSERRKQMLLDLTTEFIKYKEKVNIEDDLGAMRDWALNVKPEDYKKSINGRYIPYLGIANYQYLRMLCGVNTIKPDSHIMKGIEDALGYVKKPLEAIRFIEKVSECTSLTSLEIDQILWAYYASEIPDIGWKDDTLNINN